MTRRNKRFLSLLLALTLAVSLCVLPAAAADRTCPSSKNDPVVFVHGLMGWGERAGLNSVLPYWGMTTGSLTAYLNSLGYETYSATVGPISSAWDRACELYAQLTGTTVDYGAAHSAAHDHARYGITYDRPLFGGWGTRRAVNLVGHSFGGATTRLFLELMANGSAEEVAAAKAAGTAPSPLFTGGKSSWVHSMTEVAAPHNGTSFIESNGTIMDVSTNLAETLAKGFGITELKNLLDFQLEQFGIYKDPDETVLETLQRVFSTDFLSHNDNAFLDLTIDKSLEINDGIGIEPNVYYFSYAGNQTVQDPVSGNYIPSARMWTLFYPGAYNMGKYYDKYTAGGFYIDKSWRPNDGMVNTVSAFYPIHSDGTCLTKDGKQGWTNYDGYSNINFQPGIWYVMPVQSFDHIQFVGGMLNGSLVKTRALYRGVMEDIYSTYTTAPSGTAFPFTDVAESRWCRQRHERYDLLPRRERDACAVRDHARRARRCGHVELPGHAVSRCAGRRVVRALRQLGARQRHRQRHERHDLLARRQDHAAGHGCDALSVYAALRCRTAAADGHALYGREQHLRLCSARCAGAAPCRCHQRHARRQLPAVRHCDP